jgi:hypothetical protein
MDERSEMSNRRKGCRDDCCVIDQLRGAIGKILHNIPEAKSSNELAGYNRNTALSACSGILQDEIWENINPGNNASTSIDQCSAQTLTTVL